LTKTFFFNLLPQGQYVAFDELLGCRIQYGFWLRQLEQIVESAFVNVKATGRHP
jgi:hypothetical protein